MPAEEVLEMLPITVDEVSEAASLASDEDAAEVEEVWVVDVAAGEVDPRHEGEDDEAAEEDEAAEVADAEDDGEQQDEEKKNFL